MRNDNSTNKEKEKEKETNIQVVVRCRGRSEREIKDNSPAIVHTNSPHHLTVKPSFHDQNTARTYTFDSVYGPDASQQTVFLDVVKPMLEEILKGYNSTILCYGQTGTGKTFTMEGDLEAAELAPNSFAGIIPRTLHHLFRVLETNSAEYSVRISYLELYNEELKDLLAIEDARLRMFEDATRKGVVVHGLEELLINNVVDGITALKKGSFKRRTAATKCNENSSRSHTIFSITVHMKEATPDGEDLLSIGKLNLVDLAGSENISRSGAENRRAREAGLINQSLLTLGRVINSLVERSAHVPYRESKLTRLLQDSLGGKTKTSIIATVSPAKYNLDETLSTLDYANRAKNIRNKPEVNQRMTKKALIREYVAEIERLKSDLSATRDKNGVFLSAESYQHLQDENQSRKDQINEMKRAMEATEKQIQLTEEKFRANMELVDSLRTDLISTRQLLSEQEVVTGAYARTEEKLNSLAAGLVATLQESVRDVNGLHAKIDRKRKLETENLNACDEFQRVLLAKTTEIESQFATFRTDQTGFYQDLIKQSEGAVEDFNVFIDEVSRRSVDETIRQLAVDFEAMEESSTLRGQANETLRKRMEELRKDFVHMITGKHKEATRSHLSNFDSIKGSIESYSNQVQHWHADVLCKYDHLKTLVQGHGEDQASALSEMRRIVQNETDVERSRLQEQNRRLTAMLNEERQESSRDRDKLIQQIGILVTNFSERRNQAMTSQIEDIQREITEAHETVQSFEDSYVQESQSAEKGLQDYQASFSTAFSDIEHQKKSANENSLRHVESLTSGINDLQQSVITNLEEIHGSVHGTMSALNDMSNAAGIADADAILRDVHAIQKAKENLSERFSELKAGLEQFRGQVDENQNGVRTAAATRIRDSELFDKEFDELISHAREEVGGLVAKRIKYDRPTGKTPRRRIYKFPRSWRLTQPKEEMLEAIKKGRTDEGNVLVDGGEVIEYANFGGEEEDEGETEMELELERDAYDSDETCSPTKSSRRNFDKENLMQEAMTTTPPQDTTQKSSQSPLPSDSLPSTPTTRLPRRRALISKNFVDDGEDDINFGSRTGVLNRSL